MVYPRRWIVPSPTITSQAFASSGTWRSQERYGLTLLVRGVFWGGADTVPERCYPPCSSLSKNRNWDFPGPRLGREQRFILSFRASTGPAAIMPEEWAGPVADCRGRWTCSLPLLHGPGDPRLCNTVVTPSEEGVLSTSEDQSRRFSRTSAEGRSPLLLVHTQHRVPPWPTERQPLSHPNALGSHVLAVSSETVARYGQVQGRCSLCLIVLQWQHKTANGVGTPSGVPITTEVVAIADGLAAPPTMLHINPAAISPVEP